MLEAGKTQFLCLRHTENNSCVTLKRKKIKKKLNKKLQFMPYCKFPVKRGSGVLNPAMEILDEDRKSPSRFFGD